MNKKLIIFILLFSLIFYGCANITEKTKQIVEKRYFCGDSKCTEGENSQNCPKDCGCPTGYYLTDNVCSPKCGDGIKTNEETAENCCLDTGCSVGYTCEQNSCVELKPQLNADFQQKEIKSITFYKAKERIIGTLKLTNTGNSIAKNIKVEISSPEGYFNNEIVNFGDIERNNAQTYDIALLFTDKAFDISSEYEIRLDIKLQYQDKDNRDHSDSEIANFKVMGKNFMSWFEPQEIASWITPNHPIIKEFASKATAGLAASSSVGTSKNQELAARWLMESMRAYGIRYVNDPFNKQGDYVQFPTETLLNKAGDCEDNAVLFASLMAAVGMEPVFILTPSHAFAGYKNKEGQLVPIETTSLDFDTALAAGINNVQQNQGSMLVIELDWRNNPQAILPVKGNLKLPSITKNIGKCGISFNLPDLFVASVPVTFTNDGEVPGAGCAVASVYDTDGNLKDEDVGCWVIQPGETKKVNYQPDISVFSLGYYCNAK